MLITNHVLAGACIGLVSRTIPTAAAAALASHFAMDAIPHYGAIPADQFYPLARRDGLTGLAVSAAALAAAPPHSRTRVAVGIFAACLPDTDKPAKHFFGRTGAPAWLRRFHRGIQSEHPNNLQREAFIAAGLTVLYFGAAAVAATRGGDHQ